jgi:dTMP kinase
MESEGIEFMKDVRNGFLSLHKMYSERIVLIDGNKSIEVIADEIFSIFSSRYASYFSSSSSSSSS